MSSSSASAADRTCATEALVEALAGRLRRVDLTVWAQITEWAEEVGLAFEDLRLLLALTTRDVASDVRDLARVSGLPIDAAYRAVHHLRGRGYLREERRRYSLNEEGRGLVVMLDAAHQKGIRTYVEGLDARERQLLGDALRMAEGKHDG